MSETTNPRRGTLQVVNDGGRHGGHGRHGFRTEQGVFIGFIPYHATGWFPVKPGEYQHQGRVQVNVQMPFFLVLHPAPGGEQMQVTMETGISSSPQDTELSNTDGQIKSATLDSEVVQIELDMHFGFWTLSLCIQPDRGEACTYWILLDCMDYAVPLFDPDTPTA